MTDYSLSLMKSVFRGEIPEDLAFPFPSIDPDEADMVKIIDENLLRWAAENFDAAEADAAGEYPEGAFKALTELGFFGLNIPEEYGGLGLSMTAYARIYGTVSAIDGSLPVTLGAHSSIGLKGIILYGTEDQKKRYLPKAAEGTVAAFCLTEPGAGSDAASIQTRAVKQPDGSWILNGQKMWITNGGYAGFFTVFAKTEFERDGETQDKITAFIVDGDSEGLTRGPEEHKLGIKASSTTAIYFDDVHVSAENVLGEVGKGFKIAMHVLNSGRLGLAAGVAGGSRVLMKLAVEHATNRKQFGSMISEFELIQEKITNMAVGIYVVEAMTYLTTHLVDRGDVDYSIESAICKVFAAEKGWEMVNDALQIMGGLGYMKDYPFERVLRDTRINMIFEGTDEVLRLFIALSGMQEPGDYLKQLGKSLKEPIKGFGFLTNYAITRVKGAVSQPKMQHVHPALKKYGDQVTKYVEKLSHAVNSAIMKFGKRVVNRELMLKRFADSAIDLYGMIAVLSRVTKRIEEVGKEGAARDIDIARIFCDDAWPRIRRNLRQIKRHNDRPLRRIAGNVIAQKGYDFPL